jgi:hypothetical protein
MEELLKKLLETEVLTEETSLEIREAFKAHLDKAVTTAREEAAANVTAELNEQWIAERETLIEAIDEKVSEVLIEELKELKEDIERFRDLEAEHAENLVEAKNEMAEELKKDMETLLERLDTFLEVRLSAEVEELRADVEVVKKNEFGRKVFESFVAEFRKHYSGDDSAEGKLTEAQARLEDALTSLEGTEKKLAKMERNNKMRDILAPVSGRTREVMEAILKNVDTPLLEDAYATYIGRVMKDTTEKETSTTSEKETKVLAEGEKKSAAKSVTGKTVTGNSDDVLAEGVKLEQEVVGKLSQEEKHRLHRIAGIS